MALTLALLAWSGAPALAQSASAEPSEPGAFDAVLNALNLKAKTAPAPDFVRKSRRTDRDFIPVGTPHPDRAVKTLTPAEVAAMTDELDAARIAQQRKAGLKAVPVPDKKPSGAAEKPATVR